MKPVGGRIITFYSYKGGTGRSMAVANVAWILASQGRRVMVIDWDLEAPGLHRYLHPFLDDKELSSSPGLVDFFADLAVAARSANTESAQESAAPWWNEWTNLLRYTYSLNWEFPGKGTIDFVPAGRQGASYSVRATSFPWQAFYQKMGGGVFLEGLKQQLRSDYDYVLIDSRTGISDTSGICTVQMPDDLVLCFTLNRQSMLGAQAVAESAWSQRLLPSGEPALRIWPVPMRIELSEKERLEAAREVARTTFQRYLGHLTREERRAYWGAVEVLHMPYFAYEEVLAVFAERRQQPSSLVASFQMLTKHVTDGDVVELGPMTEHQRLTTLQRFIQQQPAAQQERRTGQVFISYPRSARAYAVSLVARLQDDGFPVFWDEMVPLGASIMRSLEAGLAASDTVLVLAGLDMGPGQETELALARSEGKRVIPIAIEGRFSAMPPALADLRGFALHERSIDQDLAILSQRLAPLLEKQPSPPLAPPDPEDPQKGRWGGQPTRNGRALTATVGQTGDDWFSVVLYVQAESESRPLTGQVQFHLHPNFHPSVKVVDVKAGVAKLRLKSWGAFTVGAVTDEGATRLELDLSQDPSYPEVFRSR